MAGLNEKQLRFAHEYFMDPNITQAAIRAGYSEASAHVTGCRLLKNDKVVAEIEKLRADRSEKTGIDAAWLLNRLAAEATADAADIFDEDTGGLKPIHEWPMIWRQGLIAGIDVFEEHDKDGEFIGFIKRVKMSDRVKRLEMIGKHVKVMAFKEVIEHKGLGGIADRLARAKQRRKSEEPVEDQQDDLDDEE